MISSSVPDELCSISVIHAQTIDHELIHVIRWRKIDRRKTFSTWCMIMNLSFHSRHSWLLIVSHGMVTDTKHSARWWVLSVIPSWSINANPFYIFSTFYMFTCIFYIINFDRWNLGIVKQSSTCTLCFIL